jgi:hypothetical protein
MSNYYFPEDIKLAWGNALPEIKEFAANNGGKLLSLSFICIGGAVQWKAEMSATPIEPLSQTIKPSRQYDWFQVIRSLQSAVSLVNGRCLVTITVVLSAQGEPVLWTKPQTCGVVAVARD